MPDELEGDNRTPDPICEAHRALLETVRGGPKLIEWVGYATNFHDAELLQIDLQRDSPSEIRLRYWRYQPGSTFEIRDHCVVSIQIEDVLDLEIDGFSARNILFSLMFGAPQDRPERRNYFPYDPTPNDIEITLDPTWGIGGWIVARGVSVSCELQQIG